MARITTWAGTCPELVKTPAQPAVLEIEILDPAREPDLPAHLLELAPQGADNQRQAVRPEVGAMLVEDRRLAVAFGQDFQDPQHVGAGIARGELAVAEGAGPPLAEEVVAFRVERAPLVEPADVGHAFLHGAAAFQDQGAVTVLGQEVAGDQTGRAGADDHGPVVQRSRAGLGPPESLGDERLDLGIRPGSNLAGLERRAPRPPSRT